MKLEKLPNHLTKHSKSKLEQLYFDTFGAIPIVYQPPYCAKCGRSKKSMKRLYPFSGFFMPAFWQDGIEVCSPCLKILKINQSIYAKAGDSYLEKAMIMLQNQPAFVPEKPINENAN
jgi:hypothetical protein